MNPRLSTDTTTPDTALIPKHAGWAAAQTGKEAWIIDNGGNVVDWFTYTPKDIQQMRNVRKHYCEKLREGKML